MVLDEPQDDDDVVRTEGLMFIYNRNEKDLLDRTLIDYKDSWFGEGFTVCSPQSEPC